MEEAFKERGSILESILQNLFKTSKRPSDSLIKNISIHQTLSATPQKITSLKTIKPNIEAIFDKFLPTLNVVEMEKTQLCPLTQAEITKPWTGLCGHTFEESTILDYMTKRRDKYCPIHGCNKKLA